MLREIPHVLQTDGEPRRRWFQSILIDLIVWFDDQDRPTGFQLCYGRGRPGAERALTWNAPASYRHMAVDDGEDRPFRHKATPILISDGTFDVEVVSDAFLRESAELPAEIVVLVVGQLREYSENPGS